MPRPKARESLGARVMSQERQGSTYSQKPSQLYTSGYLGVITTKRETKELTEKSHWGIV